MKTNIETASLDETLELSRDPKFHKVRLNMFVDGDIVLAIRKAAELEGSEYQTLVNKALREAFINDPNSKETKKVK